MAKQGKQDRMGGRPGPGEPIEKVKDFKGTFKKLMRYISKYHLLLVVVAILTVGSTVFNILGPKILGKATTEIFNGLMGRLQGGPSIDFHKLGRIAAMLIILYVVSMIMSYVQGIIMANIVQKIAFRMRGEISAKINKIPMNYYDKNSFGDVLSRITNDVDTLTMGLNQSVTQMISSVLRIGSIPW
mgnify:CR=1 FL=1